MHYFVVILGLVDDSLGDDDLPYTTLSYANGPGGYPVQDSFRDTGKRPNLTETDTGKKAAHENNAVAEA